MRHATLKNLGVLNLEETLEIIVIDSMDQFDLRTITSAYRQGDMGVHGTQPLRGLDKRCRDKNLGKVVEDYINSRWIYDSTRPEMLCCKFHDVGHGPHLHFQSHPRTEFVG